MSSRKPSDTHHRHRLQPRRGGVLRSKFGLQLRDPGVDLRQLAPVAGELLLVAAEEIADGLDADLDRAGGLVFVNVLEAEVRRAALLDDLLDDAVDRGVVPALEAG